MSKKEKKTVTSPERLVLALIENAHFEEALVLLDELEDKNVEPGAKANISKTAWLYAKALATFAVSGADSANAILHQAFASNNFVLPLMVSRVNEVEKLGDKGRSKKHAAKAMLPPAQHEAAKYIDLWFGSWLQTENAFDWLGNQFVEWTKTTRVERLKAQQQKMLANAKKLDLDFFLN